MNDTPCLEKCWSDLCQAFPNETRDQVFARWKTICAESNPHNDYGEFSPEDWISVEQVMKRHIANKGSTVPEVRQ
jgi:hypothetical protein